MIAVWWQKIRSWCCAVRALTWHEKFLLIAPIIVWFSYMPNFHFGKAEGANLEISLPLIYIALHAVVGLPLIWHNRQNLVHSKAVWVTGVFVLWNLLGLLWSSNPLRTFLTSGIWLVLWLNFLTCLSMVWSRRFVGMLVQVCIGAATAMSVVAIIQVAYGAWVDWGLCKGCLAHGFGFVRPSVFAIEPQFFGNLLIAPILLLFSSFLDKKAGKKEFVALFLQLMALYLTLSRGAIFAVIIAAAILIFARKRPTKAVISFGSLFVSMMIVAAFSAGMLWHGIFTQLNPRVTDTMYDSVSKSIHQLTLGIVKLPPAPKTTGQSATPSQQPIETTFQPNTPQVSPEAQKSLPKKAMFDGYVERSTNERTALLRLAGETWTKDIPTILFGVGSGGAGRAVFEHTHKTGWESEIIQNEYVSILLELGAVGLILFLACLAGVFVKGRKQPWVWAILIGFLVQWNFFSGLPNAIHLYLILMAIFVTIDRVYE